MKAKIVCWWTSSESITKRVVDQFDYGFLNNSGIDFVYDDSYDWLIVFGKLPSESFEVKNKDRTMFFVMEPSWSPNTDKNATEYSKYIFTHNKEIFGDAKQDNIIHVGPNYMLYGGRGDDGWTFANIDHEYIKNKNMSMVVTKRGNLYAENNLYDSRVFLAEYIHNNIDEVDMFGTFWEKNNKNCFGEAWNKFLALTDYRFSIGIENTRENNYISEKFYDCLLTDTIPIYYGCNNIDTFFDPGGVIHIDNIDNHVSTESLIREIIDNASEIYSDKIVFCRENKKRFLYSYNLLKTIIDTINNE